MHDVIRIVIGSADLSANKRVSQIVEVIDPRQKDRRLVQLLAGQCDREKESMCLCEPERMRD